MWTPTHVQVTVNRARNLIPKGKSGTNDCYVSIQLGKEKYQTSVKEKSVDPEWHEECDLTLEEMGKTAAKVILNVHHKNVVGIDEFLGHLELPLSDFPIYENPKSKWYELQGKPNKKKAEKYRGELEVKLAFIVQSKTSSSLSLNKGSSIMRTGSFKSITQLGEKLKLPRRSGSFKDKEKQEKGDKEKHEKGDKEKKSKTLSSIMDPFSRKKSGSPKASSKKTSMEDLRGGAQFYSDQLDNEHGVDLENFDADRLFQRVAPQKPARTSRSNKLGQQQHLSMSVPGLTLLKKDADFSVMTPVSFSKEDGDSLDEDDSEQCRPAKKQVSEEKLPPQPDKDTKESNPFEEDWEEEPIDKPFVRDVKRPAPQVPEQTTPPPLPKSLPPETMTPTLDGVISSIGLGNSSPLLARVTPRDKEDSPILSARFIPTSTAAHRNLQEMKSNDSQDSGFSRSGSYRQPIGRGSNRVKRAASDADAKKPESKLAQNQDNNIPLSDTREMASSTGRLDDRTDAGSHGHRRERSHDDTMGRSAHSIPEAIPEVESPTREDFRLLAELEKKKEEEANFRAIGQRERKYSADGRQSSVEGFPPEEHRLVVGQESSKTEPRKQKSPILPPELLEQYSDYSREELIRMVHQQKREMEKKQSYIKDLENYIDNLLVRVMETQPRLLQKAPEVATHPNFPSMTNGHHRDSQKIQAKNTRY